MAKHPPQGTEKVDVEALKKAIRALESPKAKRDRERAALFAELYEDIRDQIVEGLAKSAIVETLTAFGLSITGAVFDRLLADEATRRGEPVPVKKAEPGEEVQVSGCVSPNVSRTGPKAEVAE
jgi:hypothetical protein